MKIARDEFSRRASDVAFSEFWSKYPRKVGKLAAKKEWDKLRPNAALVLEIMAAVGWQIDTWRDLQFVPHPKTWLSQGRWLDEPIVAAKAAPWICRHLDPCLHRAMCQHKKHMPEKYPERKIGVAS